MPQPCGSNFSQHYQVVNIEDLHSTQVRSDIVNSDKTTRSVDNTVPIALAST